MTSSSSSSSGGGGGSHARDRIATLVDWALAHGATLHPSVEVYDDAQTGLSLRVKPCAGGAVAAYEPIVRLPTGLTLSYLNAVSRAPRHAGAEPAALPPHVLAEPAPLPPHALAETAPLPPHALAETAPFPPHALAETPPHVLGRLFLIREHLGGRASFWWPYIQALPQPGRDTWALLPPFWADDEAALLGGTNVEVGAGRIRDEVAREYAAARAMLLRSGQEEEVQGDSLGPLREALTPELYHWACCVFSSRSFRAGLVLSEEQLRGGLPPGGAVTADDFSVLLPLFDLANHDVTADVRWEVHERGGCALRVGRAHAPGEQVFNNYGFKTNAELLLGYGFVVGPSAHLHNDHVHLRKRRTSAAAPTMPASMATEYADEYLVSLRPLSHPSSVVARARSRPRGSGHESNGEAGMVLPSFRNVQPEMVWDIICVLATGQQRRELLPVDADGETDVHGLQCGRLLAGRVGAGARELLEKTVAVIQHQVARELDRLDRTEDLARGVGEGEGARLTRNQRAALAYRGGVRRVLEGVLGDMDGDAYFDE